MLNALHRRRSKVVGTHEKWIVVQNLRARRFVVRVIKTYERVAQKRSKKPARRLNLSRRPSCAKNLRQIGSHLQLGMAAGVHDRSPGRFFVAGENWTRHLELAQLRRQRKQGVSGGFSVCYVLEAVIEPKKGIERNKALIIQHSSDSARQFFVHPASVGSLLRRACQQFNQLVLGKKMCVPSACNKDRLKRSP